MPSTWPVTNPAASEARKITAPDEVVGRADAAQRDPATTPALNAGSPSSVATWGVSTNVGRIALTRIPWRAHSVAHWRVSDSIAPFAATYAE